MSERQDSIVRGAKGRTGAAARRHRERASVLPTALACAALWLIASAPSARAEAGGDHVKVRLSEWKVELTPASARPGPVTFEITNMGTIPHAFEVEGRGIEKSTPQLAPGRSATLTASLRAGSYEVYCPIGGDSHKMLGMVNRLAVTDGAERAPRASETMEDHGAMMASAGEPGAPATAEKQGARVMKVSGGGDVIQILPGPFPFADSAMAVISGRPADQKEDLLHKARMGPYSNEVARVSGTIALTAVDRGASGDSVAGTAEFTTRDGAHWRLVLDRPQTRDIPFNPRFGGVIMGLYYHGATGVHTPLVPTIRSSLALWAYAHLYRDGRLVADDAMVHIMLLSRTRRTGDFALQCWDCSRQPIEELQLQVTPAPGAPQFETPGGFLFVNWEKSSGTLLAAR